MFASGRMRVTLTEGSVFMTFLILANGKFDLLKSKSSDSAVFCSVGVAWARVQLSAVPLRDPTETSSRLTNCCFQKFDSNASGLSLRSGL